MYIYLIIPVLFIIDFYIFIVSPLLQKKKIEDEDKKRRSSLHEVKIKDFTLLIEEYPRKTLVGIKGSGTLDIDIPYVDIKEETFVDSINFNNVKRIYNFNIKANKVNFINSKYTSKDDAVFDSKNNLVYLYKDKSFEELMYYAKIFSISKKALRYFSNAPYVQFNKNTYDIRISKPYNQDLESAFLIVPNQIDLYYIESVSINISNITNLYIASCVEDIILEREVTFENLINDSNFFKVRNDSLVCKRTKKYVNYNGKVLRQKNIQNRHDMTYYGAYKFKKFQGKIEID